MNSVKPGQFPVPPKVFLILPRRGELTRICHAIPWRFKGDRPAFLQVCAAMCSVSLVNCKTVQREAFKEPCIAMHRSLKHQRFHSQCFAFSKTHTIYVGKHPIPEKLSMFMDVASRSSCDKFMDANNNQFLRTWKQWSLHVATIFSTKTCIGCHFKPSKT